MENDGVVLRPTLTDLERCAARMIPPYSRVLAIGAESCAIEPVLPVGCSVAFASRILIRSGADIVVILAPDVVRGHEDLAIATRLLGRPLIFAWPVSDGNRSALSALQDQLKSAGFQLEATEQATPALRLLKWVPEKDAIEAPPIP